MSLFKESTFPATVIVCTHNPRPEYFRRTIEGLAHQTLPKDKWELCVIDNASAPPVSSLDDLSWHPAARIIREDRLGLTPARLRGIAEASGNILIFVDDDNVLAPDYLETACELFKTQPDVGCLGAGMIVPEFEEEPENSVRHATTLLALRQEANPLKATTFDTIVALPLGAGLCLTRNLAKAWTQLVGTDARRLALGRQGTNLSSGEDLDIALLTLSKKLTCLVDPRLKIIHLIPASRVQRDYLLRLTEEISFSNVILRNVWEKEDRHRFPAVLLWLRYRAPGLLPGCDIFKARRLRGTYRALMALK